MMNAKKTGEIKGFCSPGHHLIERESLDSAVSDEKAIYKMTVNFLKSFLNLEEEKKFIEIFRKIKINIVLNLVELHLLAKVERKLNTELKITLVDEKAQILVDSSCLFLGLIFEDLLSDDNNPKKDI